MADGGAELLAGETTQRLNDSAASLVHRAGKRREQVAVPGLRSRDQLLGVPLDRQHPPARIGELSAFDNPIGRARRHTQAVGDAIERLVMRRIRDEPIGLERRGEEGIGGDAHIVDAIRTIDPRIVIEGIRPLARNVLNERAAKRNVDDLDSTADGQCRNGLRHGGEAQRDLTFVAPHVHVDGGMSLLPVPIRREVFAAREQETIDGPDRVGGRGTGEGRYDERE